MKILKNIEDKNKKQSKAIKYQGNKQLNAIKNINTGSKSLKTIIFFSGLSPEAKKLMKRLKKKKMILILKNVIVQKSDGKILTLTLLNPCLNLLEVFMMSRLY